MHDSDVDDLDDGANYSDGACGNKQYENLWCQMNIILICAIDINYV